jgi:hypothetical protein
MTIFNITANTLTAALSNNDSMVYAGKNGFVTEIGAIPVLCTAITSNTSSIALTLNNIDKLIDDNSMEHILDLPPLLGIGSSFAKVPISQYPKSSKNFGSIAYYDSESNVSLSITSYNISANSIVLENQEYGNALISSILPPTPFYITLYQPIYANNFSNRTAYVSGSFISKKKTDNIAGLNQTYFMEMPLVPRNRKNINLYVDGNLSNNFSWPGGTSINFFVSGDSSEATVVINEYTTPAIERLDLLSLSTFNNNYTVINTSYQVTDSLFNNELTSNTYYKIKLNKDITSDITGQAIINITPDFIGNISNVSNSSFSINLDNYPYTYELANNKIYYMYQKDKVRFNEAKLDEFGRLNSLSPQKYLVEVTNINRYNRVIGPVKKLITIEPLVIAKVAFSTVTEQIFIDTSGGASIIANISFTPIKNRDVESYRLRWRIISSDSSVSPEFTDVIIDHDETATIITETTPPINRGRTPGSNILDYEITPKINNSLGFPLRATHPLIGKQTVPFGVRNLTVAQQDNFLIFAWSIVQTPDGFVFDIDAKEVEIRRFPGIVDVNSVDDIDRTWGVSTIIDRIPFPSTNYSKPITVFGDYTFLLRVRDTSDIESDEIAAAVVNISRPTNIKVFKSYNEREPGISFITQDGLEFPTSNVNPESSFPSFSESINGGLIFSDSSNADNSNGSATGFSVFSGTSNLTTGTSSVAEYITQIRDMGKIIKGTVRSAPVLSIDNPTIAYAAFYDTIISTGVSDESSDNTILVDSAFSGLGTVLGFANANSAVVTYNSFQRTLTSGGPLGNVYAIRNPGQFVGDESNSNSYALIAGVINANAIALGEVYFANGQLSGSNSFANLTVSGNSYQLINLVQFGDEGASRNFFGPSRSIIQNLFFRYSTENVFYSAASNGVSGYPNHGNTNPFAFSGAASNSELGWKPYIAGEVDFRYLQLKLEVQNPLPTQFGIILSDFNYEVDLKEKNFRRSTLPVDNVEGIVLDYSFIGFNEQPVVVATPLGSSGALSVMISNVSESFCNVQVFDSTNTAVDYAFVNITAIGV